MTRATILSKLRILTVVLVTGGLFLSPAIAEAHDLKVDSGYTAVLHIDPDDDPQTGHSEVLNFLIGKTGASYNQNDYNLNLTISSGTKQLQRLSVQPEEFGNAGDGVAHYTFANPGVYTLDLRGTLKADNSPQFHMRYSVRVSGVAPAANTNKTPTIIALAASGLVLLAVVGFVTIRGAKRYAEPRN